VNIPSDLKYTKSHEWVRLDGETATIGITEYAQAELGDIVYVDLPTPGRALRQDESFGSVESVKTVSDLYSPIGGEVADANGALGAQSELVNTDPYGNGWLIKVRIADPAELGGLMSPDAYRALLDS
jgi:glycine cleavage system H protein